MSLLETGDRGVVVRLTEGVDAVCLGDRLAWWSHRQPGKHSLSDHVPGIARRDNPGAGVGVLVTAILENENVIRSRLHGDADEFKRIGVHIDADRKDDVVELEVGGPAIIEYRHWVSVYIVDGAGSGVKEDRQTPIPLEFAQLRLTESGQVFEPSPKGQHYVATGTYESLRHHDCTGACAHHQYVRPRFN